MRKILILVAIVSFSTTTNSVANQTKEMKSISDCIDLLPAGFKYQLVLETSIDTNVDEQELEWSILMNDQEDLELPDNEDDLRDKEIEPFIECMIPLIQ